MSLSALVWYAFFRFFVTFARGYSPSSMIRIISLSVSRMPLYAKRETLLIVFSTPDLTMPSPAKNSLPL